MPDELQLRKNIFLFVLWKDITVPLIINFKKSKTKKALFQLTTKTASVKKYKIFPSKKLFKIFSSHYPAVTLCKKMHQLPITFKKNLDLHLF